MGYKVLISAGKGKNYAQQGSIVLPDKIKVSNYIKRSIVGNKNSRVEVLDTETKKILTGNKLRFNNPMRW